jgi:hypothetical protein
MEVDKNEYSRKTDESEQINKIETNCQTHFHVVLSALSEKM